MKRRQGFTLIELLVVIAIIGILSTLAIIALSSARQKARDSKRVADINQISKALDLYYTDNNIYPTLITPGQSLSFGSTTYMAVVPSNPTPRNDGTCPAANYSYGRSADSNVGYMLGFCLGNTTGGLQNGVNFATSQGVGADGSLVGWWKMGEGTGGVINDSSGNGNTGTLTNGASWVADSPTGSGWSVAFDGVNDYVTIPNNTALKPNYMTISAWVYYDNTDSDTSGGMVAWQNNGSGSDGYGVSVLTGKIGVWIYCGNSSSSTSAINMPSGQWSHIVATYDGIRKEGYLNGTWVTGQTLNGGPMIYQNTTFRIGSSGAGYLKGRIADVRVYNRALSAGEVQALYDAGH